MPISIGASGSYKATTWWIGAGGEWKTVTGMWTGAGGVWKSCYTAMQAHANPTSVGSATSSANQTSGVVTVILDPAGTGPYTYQWEWVSGGSGITITNPTGAATSFSAAGLAVGETRTGIARCVVTDTSNGAQAISNNVNVGITRSGV